MGRFISELHGEYLIPSQYGLAKLICTVKNLFDSNLGYPKNACRLFGVDTQKKIFKALKLKKNA